MTTPRTIVGLDIGSDTVKAARVVRQGRRWKAAQTELLRLSADHRGDPAPLVARWLQTNGLAKHPIALSLSGHSVMFQTIALRDEDPRNMDQAAAVEVARFQEMSAEETSHSVLEIKTGESKRRLLLVMSRAALLETMLQSYRDQELNVIGMIPTTAAIFNFAAPLLENRSKPYILANVGPARTDLGIGLGNSLLFGRSLAGFRAPSGNNAPEAVLERAIDSWIKDLQSALSMYANLYPQAEQKPTSLVLSGDACDTPGFIDAIAQRTDFEIIDLTERIKSAYPKKPQRFAASTGTAITLFPGAPAPVNLLPAEAREELLLKSQKRYWAAAGVTGMLIFAVLMVGAWRNAQRAQQHLEREREIARRIDSLARQIESQERRAELIFAMTTPLTKLIWNGTISQDLLVEIARHLAPEDVITMIADETLYFDRASIDQSPPQNRPTTSSRRRAPDRNRNAGRNTGLYGPRHSTEVESDENDDPSGIRRVIIEGFTPHLDLSTVSRLIARLRETPIVNEHTDMLADDQIVENPVWTNMPASSEMRQFVIDVYLNPPETDRL